GAGVVCFDFERFLKEIRGVRGLRMIEIHAAPTNAVVCVLRISGDQGLENFVRFLIAALLPEVFRLLQRLGGRDNNQRKPGEAELQGSMNTNHLSIASCTCASWSRSCVSCCL